MMDLTEASLVKLAQHFYPTGYPVTADEYDSEGLLQHQRTSEYARWLTAWDKAMGWPEWQTLRQELLSTFPRCGDCTQPRCAACRRCCVYNSTPLPNGARQRTIVAAAASVLAPLYIVYCTKDIVVEKHSEGQRLFLEVPEEVKPQAATLSALVERVLGYQAFPLQFAQVQVPGIRVGNNYGTGATLLEALFDDHLESLF
jgi:hypothetical protein